jgi:hypothetical protein
MNRESASPLCMVFADCENEMRLLYVERSAAFPVRDFSQSTWRRVALGAEAPESSRRTLQEKGYCEVWARDA